MMTPRDPLVRSSDCNQAVACSKYVSRWNRSKKQVLSYHNNCSEGVALAANREAHNFKLATLSYNIKSTGQPVYLHELLSDCINPSALCDPLQNICLLRMLLKLLSLLEVLDILRCQSETVC